MPRPQGKKKQALERLYKECQARGRFAFDNDLAREICAQVGFKNHFDVTKIDSSAALPDALRKDDVFVVHLGGGRHQFARGIDAGYHRFETIPDSGKFQWQYRRSILNNINTSESNILSVGYNQRIIHDFLYEDIAASPKVYGSNRTHIPLDYRIGGDRISVSRVQVEVDMTMERQDAITVFEAKNGEPPDFNVFQLVQPVSLLSEGNARRARRLDRLLLSASVSVPLAPVSLPLPRPAQPRLNPTCAERRI